jgi:Tat protein secretion system quality control protein TatD with DNase activity
MVPTGQKGKRNMPKYLPETCLCLAKMLDMEPEAAAAQLWENANRFFNLPNE